jgi:hypothetical protein
MCRSRVDVGGSSIWGCVVIDNSVVKMKRTVVGTRDDTVTLITTRQIEVQCMATERQILNIINREIVGWLNARITTVPYPIKVRRKRGIATANNDSEIEGPYHGGIEGYSGSCSIDK